MTQTAQKTIHSKPAKAKSEHYVLDDQPGFLLRVALKRHTAFFTAKMIDSLTAPQFSTLVTLPEVGPSSQNHLGRLIHCNSATITGVVNRLKARASSSASSTRSIVVASQST